MKDGSRNAFRKRFIVACLAAASTVALFGCDSQGGNDDDPPELLSAEVFSLQTDLFAESAPKDPAAKINFAAAVLRVWPVSAIIGANLIVPAAVTGAALEDTPEFVDGAWEWETSTLVDGSSIEFSLTARPDGSMLDWSMTISGSDPETGVTYDEFELYTARTTFGEQEGAWDLYYRINGVRTNVLEASFDLGDDVKSITYSVPLSAAEHAGDSVYYESDGDGRLFLWQQVDEGLTHEIRWNAATNEGSIEATNYNGGLVACWDATFEDAPCAQ
jgi:hypothetical protein